MNNYYNFHDRDEVVSRDIDYDKYCVLEESEGEWIPFLSFPITNICNYQCIYCGQGGEATASAETIIGLDMIKDTVEMGIKHGIKKIRLTGGEPFLHPRIEEILEYFSNLGYFTLVNTNGSQILKYKEIINKIGNNIKFAVSLDTLNKELSKKLCSKDCLDDVIAAIKLLKSNDQLLRVNMVVNKYNYKEIYDIIDFCNEIGCDLKLLDVVSVPVPFGKRDDFYQEISSLEEKFMQECDEVYSHEYTRGFGTPCLRYKFKNTYVTVKNSVKGSHYDYQPGGLCEHCDHYPCHEGLYDLFALADGRVCGCRWSEKQVGNDAGEQIKYLINVFGESKYVPTRKQVNMKVRTELIK